MSEKRDIKKRLQTLRNIGPAAAEELYQLGIRSPGQLLQADPEELYERLMTMRGEKIDRCVLYQFRGAILDIPWPDCTDGKLDKV